MSKYKLISMEANTEILKNKIFNKILDNSIFITPLKIFKKLQPKVMKL